MRIQPPPSKDKDFYKAWSLRHTWCQACGVSQCRAPWPGLSTHHFVKPHRAHEAPVLLRLCDPCHRAAEGLTVRLEDGTVMPKLTIGICRTLKLVREPEEVNDERAAQLFGRNLPDHEPIPVFYEYRYRKNRPRDLQRYFNITEDGPWTQAT